MVPGAGYPGDHPERDGHMAHRRHAAADRSTSAGSGSATAIATSLSGASTNSKQWRGIAMRSDKLARNYHVGLCLAVTLHWLTTAYSNTA